MDLLIKARELGEMLTASEQAKRLELATALYNADLEAQNAVREYNSLQSKFRRVSTKMSKEQISAAESELEEIKASIEAIPIIHEVMEAQKALNMLIDEVTGIINFSLKKDTFKTSTGKNCGSGSCGGCGA